jgi:hypothetical protein
MPYSDFVTATPEAQLTCMLNLCMPGTGTVLSAFYKKGGICMKTLALGLVNYGLIWVFYFLWAILPFSYFTWVILCPCLFANWSWAQFHSFLTWKCSRETYHC